MAKCNRQFIKAIGKQDAIGNFIITPDNQNSHRVAQKKLVELKASGIKPLDAINKAEDFARHVEGRYWKFIKSAEGNRKTKGANIAKVNKAFKAKYGYIPRIRK